MAAILNRYRNYGKMRVVHLSDLHLRSRRDAVVYGVTPYKNLCHAVSLLESRTDIDLGVITGDISDDGSTASYYLADEALLHLKFPIFVLNGNHDNLSTLIKGRFTKMRYETELTFDGVDYIFINTVGVAEDGTNRSRGVISEKEYSRLERFLNGGINPVVILTHHPVTLTGSWLDRRIMENRERFIECVTSSKHAVAVLSGHNHYASNSVIGSCLFSIAPSVSTSFDKDLPPFREAYRPGFNIVTIENGITVETVDL